MTDTSTGQNWVYNDYDNSVYFYGLQASTHYQVTIQPGMADLYGTAIKNAYTVSFTTGADSPWVYLLMPWQALYRQDGPQEFYVQYDNIASVNFKLYKFTQDELSAYLQNGTPVAQDLVWTHEEAGSGVLDQQVLKKITLGDGLETPLAPGAYVLVMNSPSVPNNKVGYLDAHLLVIASASITLKSSLGDDLLWVTDLTGGQPLSGVPVTLYDQGFNPVGNGVSDANGPIHVTTTAQNVVYAMSDDATHFGFTSLSWGSGVAPDQFGISSTYYAVNAPVEAYLYTDRPVYRPGQPVDFKGIVRTDNDLAYAIPDQKTIDVSIDSYNNTVYKGTLPLSPYGTFDGKFTLDQSAALGSYTISAHYAGSQDDAGVVTFEVAEYRIPEFMVNVTATPANLLAGDNITATVSADYYSGGAVANTAVDWTLQAVPFTFTPPESLSAYNFTDLAADTGDIYLQPQQPDSVVVAQGTGTTDDKGQLTLTLPAALSKTGASQTLTFEATLTDFSGNTVSGRASVVAHQSSVYVGVKPGDYLGNAGTATHFDLVAVDWQGNPQPGQKVNVDIVERQWYSVQQQDQQGNLSWVTSVKEIPVTSFTDQVAGADGKFSVSFTPPHGGVFAARATALDAHGNKAVASGYIWVGGSEYIAWRQTNDRSFQLVADQTSYKPGDTAQLLIASPFQGDAYALVTIERAHTRKADVIHLTGNSTVYPLPITPDMAPDVYVAVTVVKGVDENNPRPDFKIGMIKLKVATDAQALNVTVTPDKTQVSPGGQVTYQVKVTDSQGKPVQAELSMSLSDLATLSLVAPNSSPILDYFYSPRSLGVTTSVSIVSSAEDYNAQLSPTQPLGRGGGSGGGKGGSGYLGVMDIRQNFPDTAYWEAHLTTGADGQATATVTLPDNLTIWRMDARAVTQDTRVGQTTVDITSSKPLLVSPQTPRFFVAGDTATLGAAVHNNTDQDMAVSVAIDAQGITMTGDAVQQVQIAAQHQAYVTWTGTVNADAQRVDLVFSATAGALQDASRPTAGTLSNQGLPVYRYEAKETVATSGQLTAAGDRSEAISLPAGINVTQGSLSLELAPSLAAGMTDGLTYLETYPYGCTEQIISSFLPNVLTTSALHAAGVSNPDLEAKLKDQVNQNMQDLANNQNADGGWGWWSSMDSDVLTSAYVVQGLVEAKAAGYTVSADVTQRGVSYLQNNLKVLETLAPPQVVNLQAYVLYVLALSGNPNPSFTVQLYGARQSLSLYGDGLPGPGVVQDRSQRCPPGDAAFGFE